MYLHYAKITKFRILTSSFTHPCDIFWEDVSFGQNHSMFFGSTKVTSSYQIQLYINVGFVVEEKH